MDMMDWWITWMEKTGRMDKMDGWMDKMDGWIKWMDKMDG